VSAFSSTTGALRWVKTPDPAVYDRVDTELFFYNGDVYVSLQRSEHNWEPGQFDAATGFWFTGEFNGRMEAMRSDGSGLPIALLSEFSATPAGGTAQGGFLFSRSGPTLLTESPNDARLTLGTDRYFHVGVGVGTAPANGVRAVATTGNPTGPLWTRRIDAPTLTTPVLSGDGRTLFVGIDGPPGVAPPNVVALDTATGEARWSAGVELGVTAPPALAGDILYVPTHGGLVALSATDGSWLWNLSGTGGIAAQPAVAGGVVFVGTADGTVWGYPADGCGSPACSVLDAPWSASTGSRITGAPAVSLGKLFVGTQDGRLIAYGLPPQ
jgi:PQQ-like domain